MASIASLAAYRFIDQCVRCMMCLSGTSSPLIRTPARAEALPFLSLFFSLLRKVSATLSRNPRVQLSRCALEVSAPESVHSSLRSFSFRDVSYDLLFNRATGSKYSFATNFHLHVSSPWGLPSSANHAFFFPLTPYRLHLFIPSPRAVVLRPKVVARELKGF